jgi:hypothetical protein
MVHRCKQGGREGDHRENRASYTSRQSGTAKVLSHRPSLQHFHLQSLQVPKVPIRASVKTGSSEELVLLPPFAGAAAPGWPQWACPF